jgi:hypothetical protein
VKRLICPLDRSLQDGRPLYFGSTGINVIVDSAGDFNTFFKPGAEQLNHLLMKGTLGGN